MGKFKWEIGKYTISQMSDESYWIEHESGEGMQVKAVVMEKLIDDFYKEAF